MLCEFTGQRECTLAQPDLAFEDLAGQGLQLVATLPRNPGHFPHNMPCRWLRTGPKREKGQCGGSGVRWAWVGIPAPSQSHPSFFFLPHPQLTLEGVLSQAQLPNDVPRQVRLDALALAGLALGSLQQVVKLLRVKLLGVQRGWSAEAWSHLQAFAHAAPSV